MVLASSDLRHRQRRLVPDRPPQWGLLGVVCDLPYRFVIPLPVRAFEVLDLSETEWHALDEAGMITHDLTPEEVGQALAVKGRHPGLSANNCFCLVTARAYPGISQRPLEPIGEDVLTLTAIAGRQVCPSRLLSKMQPRRWRPRRFWGVTRVFRAQASATGRHRHGGKP